MSVTRASSIVLGKGLKANHIKKINDHVLIEFFAHEFHAVNPESGRIHILQLDLIEILFALGKELFHPIEVDFGLAPQLPISLLNQARHVDVLLQLLYPLVQVEELLLCQLLLLDYITECLLHVFKYLINFSLFDSHTGYYPVDFSLELPNKQSS
jgi:hypothetical protein